MLTPDPTKSGTKNFEIARIPQIANQYVSSRQSARFLQRTEGSAVAFVTLNGSPAVGLVVEGTTVSDVVLGSTVTVSDCDVIEAYVASPL